MTDGVRLNHSLIGINAVGAATLRFLLIFFHVKVMQN